MSESTTVSPLPRLCLMCAQPEHGSAACAVAGYLQVDWSTWRPMTNTDPAAPDTHCHHSRTLRCALTEAEHHRAPSGLLVTDHAFVGAPDTHRGEHSTVEEARNEALLDGAAHTGFHLHEDALKCPTCTESVDALIAAVRAESGAPDTRPLCGKCGQDENAPCGHDHFKEYRMHGAGDDLAVCGTAGHPFAPDTRPRRASLELTATDLARLHAGEVVGGYTVTDMGGSREQFTVALAPDTHSGPMREIGELVREVWVAWSREQADVALHPSWLVSWKNLPERAREVDRRIEAAIRAESAAALQEARVRAERLDETLTLVQRARTETEIELRALRDDNERLREAVDTALSILDGVSSVLWERSSADDLTGRALAVDVDRVRILHLEPAAFRPVLGVTATGETVSPQQALGKLAEVARLIAESDPDVLPVVPNEERGALGMTDAQASRAWIEKNAPAAPTNEVQG